MKETVKFDLIKKTWNKISKFHDGVVDSNFELEVYKKMLGLFHVGDYYYYIFNAPRATIEWVSDDVEKVLGVTEGLSAEYVFENIHPDDRNRFIEHEHAVTKFFEQLPLDKILKYKVTYDYRLKDKKGNYKWILQQVVTIQSDENGAVIRTLGVHTDISYLKRDNKPSGLSFLGLDGEVSYYNVPVDKLIFIPSNEIFTSREKQILELVINGKSSKDISERLHISKFTVDTHRKNILSKSGCETVPELISKAIQESWV